MRKEAIARAFLGLSISITTPLMAGPVTISNTFTAGTPAKADEVNQNFSDVAGAVNDNDVRISSNAAAVAQNSAKITTNATAIGTNGDAITGLNTSVTTLSGAVGANSTSISDNATVISANSGAISSNATAISGNSTSISGLNTTVGAIDTRVTTNEGDIATNSGDIAGLNTAVGAIDTRVTTNEGDIATNSGDITTLNTTVSDHETRITANESEIGTNSTAVVNLTSSVNDHEGRIAALEGGGGGQSNELWGDLGRLLTGSVSVSTSDTLVTGSGTLFTTELNVGDAISIDGEVHSVASIISDVELQLDVAHSAGASGAFAYTDNDLLLLKTGDTQERLAVDKSGYLIRRIPRATGLGPADDTDSGQIVSRVLTVNKSRTDTALRIGYTDNFRAVQSGGGYSCSWEVRVDGAPCPGGALRYDHYNGYTAGSMHFPGHVVGYCEGIAAGSHEIQVWVGPPPSQVVANCYTGWYESRWTLEAEEVY